MKKIGLIAGSRQYPLVLAREAKTSGYAVVAIAIKHNTSRHISKYASRVFWIDIVELDKVFAVFKQESIEEIVMAGQINPFYLFDSRIIENPFIQEILKEIEDRRASTIFSFIASRLTEEGFKVLDARVFMKDFIPHRGLLTDKQPEFNIWQDIYFGWEIAKKVASLDIGQSVAIKDKVIVAVEAMEGTDRFILRSAKLAGKGLVIVKVSRPSQDMRFDLPVVGMTTIKNLIKIKASCLAIEAEKTIFLDKDKALLLAKDKGFCIVAI